MSMPASSTMQRRPGAELVLGEWWPVGAVPFVEQLGDGVGTDAGVAFEDAGGLRRRCHPEHRATLARARSSPAAASMRVLPAPAGPTTSTRRSSPATEAAASACITSRPCAVDGGRRCRRVGLGLHRPGDDVLLLGEHRFGGEAGSGRFDPHRPAIRRPPRRGRRSGRGRRRCSSTRSADRSMASSQRRPDICDTGRCASQIAWITSGRPHDDRCADTASTTSLTVSTSAGTGLRAACSMSSSSWSTVQPTSAASVCHRVARSAAP